MRFKINSITHINMINRLYVRHKHNHYSHQQMNQFLHVFRERLVVCRWQEWRSHVETSDRFNVYRTFCTIHDTKMYLKLNIDRHLKFIMTRFRLGISDIFVHHYRYERHTNKDLICPLCRVAHETELYVLLFYVALC